MKNKSTYNKPSVERFLKVLRGEIPDRVPNYEVLIEKRSASFILGREVDSHSWQLPPHDCIELAERIGMDIVITPIGGWKWECAGSGQRFFEEKVRKADLNNVKRNFVEQSESSFTRLEELIKLSRGTGIGIGACPNLIFDTSIYAVGFEHFLTAVYDDRQFIEDVLDVLTECAIATFKHLCSYDIAIIHAGDDIACKTGLFLRPDLFGELWLNRMERILEYPRRKGIPLIFHSDGRIVDVMDDIIKLGFCGVNPIEPYGTDIFEIKQLWGDKISLIGNIDIAHTLSFGSREDVVADVKNHLTKLMPHGRYICASSHSITNDVRPENFLAMVETIHEFGRY